MKLLIVIACLAFWWKPTAPILVLDKDLKKPVTKATSFTTEQYLQRCFPVYASDVEGLIDATDKLVRMIGKESPLHLSIDTLKTTHSTFVLSKENGGNSYIDVRLITTIEESATSFGFAIVEKEKDIRKAQKKVLDFATYLAQ